MKVRGTTRLALAASALGALMQACATEAAAMRPCSPSDPGAVEAPYSPPAPGSAAAPASAVVPAPPAGHR